MKRAYYFLEDCQGLQVVPSFTEGGLKSIRKVGYAIYWTLTEDKTLEKEQIQLFQRLASFLDSPEYEETSTEVHDAVRSDEGDTSRLVQAIAKQPWAIHELDDTGSAPIHLAVQGNRIQSLRCLLAEGADVNQCNARSQTPLQLAALYNRVECLWNLLQITRCSVNREDSLRKTALHMAAEAGSAKAVAMLVNAGASVTRLSRGGKTPLHLVAAAKVELWVAEEIVRLLRGRRTDLDARDEDGNTPAMLAVQFNNLSLLRTFYEAGASLHLINHNSQNILHLSALHANTDVLNYLSSLQLYGINSELPDLFGLTPTDNLRWARLAKDTELILPLRRPTIVTGIAFTQLALALLVRNLESDLESLRHLLQIVEQRVNSSTNLSFLVNWNENYSRPGKFGWYREILGLIQQGSWSQARERILSETTELTSDLESAQHVLKAPKDPFVNNTVEPEMVDESLDPETEWESCSSDDGDQDAIGDLEFVQRLLEGLVHPVSADAVKPEDSSRDATRPLEQGPCSSGRNNYHALSICPSTSENQPICDGKSHENDHPDLLELGETEVSVAMMGRIDASQVAKPLTNSCIEFPSTLPELVDAVFRKLVLLSEPPVPEGMTRIRWKCVRHSHIPEVYYFADITFRAAEMICLTILLK